MGGDETTIEQPVMPSYGEGLSDALKVQIQMLTGRDISDEGGFQDLYRQVLGKEGGDYRDIFREIETPLRKEMARTESEALRTQILGDERRSSEVYQDPDSGKFGYLDQHGDFKEVRGQDASYLDDWQTAYDNLQALKAEVEAAKADVDNNGAKPGLQDRIQKYNDLVAKYDSEALFYQRQGEDWQAEHAAFLDFQEQGPPKFIDPVTGKSETGEVTRSGTGLLDLYGPKDIAQYATEQDVAAGAAENVGDFLGYRQAGIATEADVAAGRASTVGEFMGLAPAMQQGAEYMAASQREADVRDVERLGQRATAAYRSQGTTVDSKGNVTGGIQGALDRISGLAGQTAPTTLQSYSGPTYTPPTESSPVSVNEYADPLTAAAMDRRAAMIADRESAQNITLPEAPEFSFEQRAPDLVEPQQRTVVAPAPVDVMERRYDYGQRVRPVKNLNNPNDKGQQVNAGPTTLQELSSQMGTSLDPIRSRLFSQAVSGLETGLTDRERRNVEQASRLATGARGRLRDFGSTVKEVQDVMAEDRNRLNQNRAFAQSVLGGEQALQQRELAAAEADIARAAQRQAGDRGFALQALGAEQATSADPFMSILGRPSGAAAGAAQNLLTAGQQNNAMAGPQFINPESGLSYISQMAANEANMFGAQQQANAARSAGMMGMLGSLGGGLLGNTKIFCWVAREVYGPTNPAWMQFREWMLNESPQWFFELYRKHGERFASWISDKPRLKGMVRKWMDSKIGDK